MKNKRKNGKRGSVLVLVVVFFFIVFSPHLTAKEKKQGARLLVQTKDHQTVRVELLCIKGSRLILMDLNSFSDVSLDMEEIESIRIEKKNEFLKGLGYGLLIGGASGALLGILSGDDKGGFMSMTASQKALWGAMGLGILGAPVGGIFGTVAGLDEYTQVSGKSPEAIKAILKKLQTKSRFSSDCFEDVPMKRLTFPEIPKKATKLTSIETRNIEETEIKTENSRRIHLTFGPQYFHSGGTADFKSLIDQLEFGGIEYFSGFFGSGSVEYPKAVKDPRIFLMDIHVEYSLSKKIAIGVMSSSMGHHRINGRNAAQFRIDHDYGSYDQTVEFYLQGNYAGRSYFLTAAYMPLPDAFLRKSTFKIGFGIGFSQIDGAFLTSKFQIWDEKDKYGYSDDLFDEKNFSKKPFSLIVFGGYRYYFNKSWSIGANVDYRYIPTRIQALKLTGYYQYYNQSQFFSVPRVIDIPENKVNFGGLGFGITFGIHL